MNRGELSDIDLIQQAIDFVEAQLQEAITVADIAESVSFSLYHFSRVFSRVTRHTPYDYLMRRRLSEAALRLLLSDENIIEIAYDFQFNAPETFSRAFKRIFKLQPRQARQQGGFDPRLLLTKPTPDYLKFLNSAALLKPTAVELPAMEIAGLAAQISSRDAIGEIKELWNMFGQELVSNVLVSNTLDARKRSCLGVVLVPAFPAERVMYLAGTTLAEGEEIPDSFVQKSFKAMNGASFAIPTYPGAAQFTRQYTYHTWWPKATNEALPRFEIECFNSQNVNHVTAGDGALPRSLFFPLTIE